MEFCSFNQVCPEVANNETRSVLFLEDVLRGPLAGKYHFIEIFCMDPDCDCHNAMIGVYREGAPGQFQEITKLRFCWEDRKFYNKMGLDFFQDELPGVFLDMGGKGSKNSKFFIKYFGDMCYENFHEKPSLRRETEYAKRVKKHYSLFKEKISKG